jgi:tripartite-type tricarboxylate transporter receptor subunit TctC
MATIRNTLQPQQKCEWTNHTVHPILAFPLLQEFCFMKPMSIFSNIFKHLAVSALVALLLLPISQFSWADTWPSRTVKVLVGFPAGSSPDLLARMLAEELAKKYKQPFIVENRPGAGGMIALKQMVQAEDDHLLVVSPNGPLTTSPLLYKSITIDSSKDYQALSLVASSPLVFVVAASSPYRSMNDFAAAVKSKGLAITYGSVGAGSGSHLVTELLLSRLKAQATHVPFTGFPQMVAAVVGEQIDGGFVVPSIAKPLIASGKLRAIAISSKSRLPSLIGIEPIQTLGNVGEFDFEVWNGVIASNRLPKSKVAELSAAITAIVKSPESRQKLDGQGWRTIGGSPEALQIRIKTDTLILSKIVNDLNLTLEGK